MVNQKGECVDEAEVTYFLADKMSKVIISGLTTFDESGRMLSSAGMFYINAQTPDGEQLYVSQESSLLYETLQSRRHNDQGIYSGTEGNGKITWTAEGGSEAVVNISYSATDLYPDPYWLNTGGPYYQLADEKYDFTNMATFGMAERLRKSEGLSSYVAWLRDPDDRRINSSLLDIYVRNLDKPLYYSDSLVIDLVQRTLDSCLQAGGECLFKERIPSHLSLIHI